MKKIFKRFTLFDRVLIAISLFAIAFFLFVFFRKSTFTTIVVKVGESGITLWDSPPWNAQTGTKVWFGQSLFKGIVQKDGLGREMARVTDVRSFEHLGTSQASVYLTIRLRVVYSRATGQYTFNGVPLVVGAPIKLNFEKFLIDGLVTHMDGVKDPREVEKIIVEAQIREEKDVYAETSGTRDYIANAIKVGDKYKDSLGNVIVTILDKRVGDAKRLVVTQDGRTLVRTNPLRKDVTLTLEINAFKIGDRYYLFDDVPIIVGYGFPLITPETSVMAEATKITVAD